MNDIHLFVMPITLACVLAILMFLFAMLDEF